MEQNELLDLKEPLLKNNTGTIRNSIPKNYKIAAFSVLLVSIFLWNNLSLLSPLPQGMCYSDSLFNLTQGFNSFFQKNVTPRNVLLISSSLFADLTIMLSFGIWCFKMKDSSFIIATFVFYAFRYFILGIFLFGFPNNYLFTYPGIKSLFISYYPTNDFFYSGHTGFPVIIFLEYSRKKYKIIPTLAIITLIVEFCTMLFLRGHYSIDLIAGIFCGYFIYQKTLKFLKFISK